MKYNYYIGIDPGVNTGIAIWNKTGKCLGSIRTLPIHQAMGIVYKYKGTDSVFVRVEDARQRKWFGERAEQKQQGAGSVKRDCKIWEDLLTDLNIPFEMVAPRKGMTKYSAAAFKKLTGYEGKTSEHARDAGMLVFGL
jgi:hypothetical protein